MRLVTYDFEGMWRAGIVIEGRIVDAASAAESAKLSGETDWTSSRQIIQATAVSQSDLETAARQLASSNAYGVYQMEDVRLGPPIPDPEKIICLGLNYRSHAEEAGFEAPKVPILFAKYRNALNGPTDQSVCRRSARRWITRESWQLSLAAPARIFPLGRR